MKNKQKRNNAYIYIYFLFPTVNFDTTRDPIVRAHGRRRQVVPSQNPTR